MATSAAERFAKIFATTQKPALPDPGQPHLADTELAMPEPPPPKPQPPEHFKIPDVPQLKRRFLQENRHGARDVISSSEDEDDYVNAFKSNAKPQMLESSEYNGGMKPRQAAGIQPGDQKDAHFDASVSSPESNHATGMRYSEDCTSDRMKDDAQLPTQDIDGNKVTGHFCIFSLVSKFPYKYMKDPNDKVSRRFFAANQFYTREWDIYYVQPPEITYSQPIILLPVKQVEQLLNEISSAFKTSIRLPPAPFTISFFDDKTPQPIFLGRTHSRGEYTEILKCIPPTPEGHGECPEMAPKNDNRAFEDFRKKCEATQAANKKGKTSKQAKKAAQKFIAQSEGASGLRRLQRFVGLLPRHPKRNAPPDPSLPFDVQQQWEAYQVEKTNKKGSSMTALDVKQKAQFPYDKNVVFVAFDVEANEHAHHQITEIGVSTLDIYNIRDIAPGPGGAEWIKQIRSRHFRIKERAHIRNNRFVHGNPDGFRFGKSEFVPLKDAAKEVDDCFIFPFTEGHQLDNVSNLISHERPDLQDPTDRCIVLVGHDIDQDIEYLSKLGSKIFTPSLDIYPPVAKHEFWNAVVEVFDVAVLYKTLKKENQARSLGSVMADLGRDAWDLHNAGNDARYTMEALIALAVKARQADDEGRMQAEVEKARIAKQVEDLNRAWAARDADPNDSNHPPVSASTGSRGEPLFANTDSAEEAAALNATFLDPLRNPAFPTTAPGRGHHHGSGNGPNEISEAGEEEPAGEPKSGGREHDWFDHLVKTADERLKLQPGDGDDNDEEDFEM